jgi:hypothetical protein
MAEPIRITDRSQKNKNRASDSSFSDAGFEIHSIEEAPAISGESVTTEKVKVRFDKFAQLVATHNFDEVLRENAAEEIVMSSNLLMDLANAHETPQEPDKKIQVMFAVGLVFGIALMYIVLKLF